MQSGDSFTDVSMASPSVARAEFIANTYIHLLGAMIGFVLFEMALFTTTIPATMVRTIAGSNFSWLFFLGGFVLVSWMASRVAATAESKGAQYAALVGFVAAEAVIFAPMIFIAELQAGGVIQSAALVTLLGFVALTGVAWTSRKDFSFLGAMLRWGFGVAMLAIVGGAVFGFELGTWFSVGMIGFAGAAILYDTSKIIHHYPDDRYVSAALELFASVALMFWYVLRLFMSRD